MNLWKRFDVQYLKPLLVKDHQQPWDEKIPDDKVMAIKQEGHLGQLIV